jgi:hypothetical protein
MTTHYQNLRRTRDLLLPLMLSEHVEISRMDKRDEDW